MVKYFNDFYSDRLFIQGKIIIFGLNKCGATVGTFHTKGWTKFFSGQIYTFWGQNNVFYDSARLQVIF
jgi:hypothetical protein